MRNQMTNKARVPQHEKDVMIHEEWEVEIMHIDEEEPIKNQPLFHSNWTFFFALNIKVRCNNNNKNNKDYTQKNRTQITINFDQFNKTNTYTNTQYFFLMWKQHKSIIDAAFVVALNFMFYVLVSSSKIQNF